MASSLEPQSALTAGDPAEAEGPLREGVAALEVAAAKGWLSTIAEVLWRQGKHEEAERYALHSDRLAAPDDWMSQWQWRAAQAKVLADRDEPSEAETLAREAVSVIDQTDYIKSRGDARGTAGSFGPPLASTSGEARLRPPSSSADPMATLTGCLPVSRDPEIAAALGRSR